MGSCLYPVQSRFYLDPSYFSHSNIFYYYHRSVVPKNETFNSRNDHDSDVSLPTFKGDN